jgi:hypothetical protein
MLSGGDGASMIRILHSADWRLGLRPRGVPASIADRLASRRFEAVEALAALAHQRRADLVLVAGDVLYDSAAGPNTLRRAAAAIDAFAPLPVLLLPGHSDPAQPGGAITRLGAGPHAQVLAARAAWEHPAVVVLPCPIHSRLERGDPSTWVPPRPAGDRRPRVLLAQAGLLCLGGQPAGCTPSGLGPPHAAGASAATEGPLTLWPGPIEPWGFEAGEPGVVWEIELEEGVIRTRCHRLGGTRWLELPLDLDAASARAWPPPPPRPSAPASRGVVTDADPAPADAPAPVGADERDRAPAATPAGAPEPGGSAAPPTEDLVLRASAPIDPDVLASLARRAVYIVGPPPAPSAAQAAAPVSFGHAWLDHAASLLPASPAGADALDLLRRWTAEP